MSTSPFSDPSPTATSTFWGPLLSPFGAASPVLHRFLNALFTHYDGSEPPCNTHALENGKISSVDEAMGDSPNENSILVLCGILKPHGFSRSDLDSATVLLYEVFQIPHVMSTRQSNPPVWDGMPVVPYEGFVELQVQKLSQEPRKYWEGMNRILAGGLIDVETGVEFTDTIVPWESFPQEPVAELVQRDVELSKVFWKEFETWLGAFVEKRRAEKEEAAVLALQAQQMNQDAMAQNMKMMHESSMAAQRFAHNAMMTGIKNSMSYIA